MLNKLEICSCIPSQGCMTCPDLVKATVVTSPSLVETEKQRPFNFLKIRKEKVLGKYYAKSCY